MRILENLVVHPSFFFLLNDYWRSQHLNSFLNLLQAMLKLFQKELRIQIYSLFSVLKHPMDSHHILLRKDRKSTRLNSSHVRISYAVFCLKKKTKKTNIFS